ncbi:YbhB/YbcL family Raf kinase inhibitor-like protein [Candidatus Venteria ishoeyi]|uniref:Putative kinase inhibitor n=1 Tax=Candidatus Venteria ishoeyi TaxID=1899563 RepID=A0A1H6FC44_9GAMM|nr:YbhB/YbcL family Raf kinase inhibitor-like protein [Candidatus Venteria ishoeyi]MDM8545602.1 YbhB/YbcL family Raf kinase inhibitor-like protein [Candidatus Venteria ishoeyi]SEH07660.1 putative kinase inhibitor [Candidatus Venteria ishoeyi]
MKKMTFILSLMLYSLSAWAVDEAEYDVTTSILTIPSVKIAESRVYDAQLQLNADGLFSLLSYSDTNPNVFTLSSPAISNGELLSQYQCEEKTNGVESSIPLSWSNVPSGTAALAVTMVHYPNSDDTSQPNAYLLLWGIDASVTEIEHGAADDGPWYLGANKDGNMVSYTSPCSPSTGSHEYTLNIYALSETPGSLPTENSLNVSYDVLMQAIDTVEVLGTASITFDSVTVD